MKESTLKKFLRMPKFDEHLDLHRVDCQSSHGDLTLYNLAKERLAAFPPETIRPKPLLKGDALIAEGDVPGPPFAEILSAVEDAQLEGELKTEEDAMGFVRAKFPADFCRQCAMAALGDVFVVLKSSSLLFDRSTH